MLIKMVCPHCQKVLKVAAEHAGQTHPCPACYQQVTIPTPDALRQQAPSPGGPSPSSSGITLEPPPSTQPKPHAPPADASGRHPARTSTSGEPAIPPGHRASAPDPAGNGQRTIRIACPHCQKVSKVSAQHIGEIHPCPACHTPIQIRDPELLEELRPAGAPRPVPTPRFADAPSLSDEELAAQLQRQRRDASGRKGGIASWFSGLSEAGKHRYERIKLQGEIQGLDRSLDQEYVDLGAQVLEQGRSALPIDGERRRLREILTEIGEREDRLKALEGAQGTGSIARELRREIEQCEQERDEVLAGIGRVAHRQRSGEGAILKKLDDLQDMRQEHWERLEELGGAVATSAGETRARRLKTFRNLAWWISWISVVLTIGTLLAWPGYRFVLAPYLNPLYAFRYDIPPDADMVAVVHFNKITKTYLYRKFDDITDLEEAMVSSTRKEGLPIDPSQVKEVLFAGSIQKGNPTGVSSLLTTTPLVIGERFRERYRLSEHRGHTVWISKSEPDDAVCLIAPQHLLSGKPRLVEDAIDRWENDRPAERAKVFARLVDETPKGTHVLIALLKGKRTSGKDNDPLGLNSAVESSESVAGFITLNEDINLRAILHGIDARAAKHNYRVLANVIQKVKKEMEESKIFNHLGLNIAGEEMRLLIGDWLDSIKIDQKGPDLILTAVVSRELAVKFLVEPALKAAAAARAAR